MLLLLLFACGEDVDKTQNKDTSSVSIDTSDTDTGDIILAEPSEESCEESEWYEDFDGDGFGNPFVMTFACEQPTGFCDNHLDCDDNDQNEFPEQTWFIDVDGDGFGNAESSILSCSRPIGYILDNTDCDDNSGDKNPEQIWYVDADSDGFGSELESIASCDATPNFVPNNEDCDDDDWLIHPMANEICDFIDNDCDFLIDDDDNDIDIFTQVFLYIDNDGDSYGDGSLGFGCESSGLGALLPGDCDDSDPFTHPNQVEYVDDIDHNCDGEAHYTNVSLTAFGFIGDVSSSAFGRGMDAKDIDGDGTNELLIGAYTYNDDHGGIRFVDVDNDAGNFNEFPSASLVLNGVNANDRAGFSMAFVGDMTGDGVEDFLTGAYRYNDSDGAVYLVSTDTIATDLEDTSLHTVVETGSELGYAITPLGDIDGDGKTDALISAPKESSYGNNRGVLYVMYGDELSNIIAMEEKFSGESNGDRLGIAIKNVGDTNGDGFDDILIGAPYADDESSNGGVVYLISTTDFHNSTMVLSELPRYTGSQEGEHVGYGLAKAGDTNADGYQDMLIGAPDYDENYSAEGAAYLLMGDGFGWEGTTSLDTASLKMIGENDNDKVGIFMNTIGDFNGDGNEDFALAAHNHDLVANNSGAIYGILGNQHTGVLSLEQDADFILLGATNNDGIGKGLVPAGDTNGDGLFDFWVAGPGAGSTGSVYLWHGAESP